jgi:hypothetical protein
MSKAGLMLVAALAVSGGVAPSDRGDGGWAADTVDAIAYIRRSLHDYPIVGLAEGGHAALEPHEFLRRVLTDEGVLRAVDVVIVEFATAREQPVLDAYIDGADISFDELSGVWRNTSTSPVAPWDSPLYRELLAAIRNANQALPRPQRVRVLAGDPPIDWERIETRDDFGRAIQPRDLYVAQVAIEQAFGLGKKVLIVFGGAHLPKVPVGGEDDGRRVGHSAAEADGNLQYPIPPMPNIQGSDKEPALAPLGYWIFVGVDIGY